MNQLLRSASIAALSLSAATVSAQELYDEGTVRTLELTFRQSDWWQQLGRNYAARKHIKADLRVGGKVYKDVGVRFRGNSSYYTTRNQKKPFEIKMNAFVPGQRLLGYKTLNLNNGYRDPTFTREVLTYWIFRKFEVAGKANHVVLRINNQNWGVYVNVQQVNKDMMKEWYRDDDGNRYRAERSGGADWWYPGLNYMGSGTGEYKKGYELKTENSPKPWVDLIELCRVLNKTASSQLQGELVKVLDVDNALRYLACNNVIPSLDSYIGKGPHNYYLFNNGHHGRFNIIPWDLNSAFGANSWMLIDQKIKLPPLYFANDRWRPLINKVFKQTAWKERYFAHMRTVLDEIYDWRKLGPRIAEIQKRIEPHVKADPKRLYSMQLFYDNVTKDLQIPVGGTKHWIPGLKPYIEKRRAYLLGRSELNRPAPALASLGHWPLNPSSQQSATVTVRASNARGVWLHYRVTGAFTKTTMYDDGKHGDGRARDGIYGAAIPPQAPGSLVQYYVEAQHSSSGALRFLPRTAAFQPPVYRVLWPRGTSAVKLNELVARNVNGPKDEKGERDDWFELVNDSANRVTLGGLYLTDDLGQPKKWQIPGGYTLGPWQTLHVWADGDTTQGPLHATFKLDGGGEELALFANDGKTMLDWIEFGAQSEDIATGRLFDGKGPWVGLPKPTPWSRNAVTCGFRSYLPIDPSVQQVAFSSTGAAKPGATAEWSVSGAPASSFSFFFMAALPGNFAIPGQSQRVLFDFPLLFVLPWPTDARGNAKLRFAWPNQASLVGKRFFTQSVSKRNGTWWVSNAVETTFCR